MEKTLCDHAQISNMVFGKTADNGRPFKMISCTTKWCPLQSKSYVIGPETTKKFRRFDAGEHPFPLTPMLNKVLKNIKIDNLKQRPDIFCQAVKKAAAKFWGVDHKNIVVTNGSDQIIEMIPRLFLNPGDTALVINPTFFLFAEASIKAGGEVAAVETNIQESFRFTDKVIDALIKLSQQKRAKIIWICHPNNPTGEALSLTQIKKISKNTDGLVVVDEVFFEISDLTKKESAVTLINKSKNIIVLKSLSKSHGLIGVRVGFTIADRNIISLLENWRLPFSVSTIAQKIAVAIINDQSHFIKIKQAVKKERDWLFKSLKRLNDLQLGGNSKANIFLLRHKKRDLFAELLKRKILAADFRNADSLEGQGFVRLTIQNRRRNKILLNALSEI